MFALNLFVRSYYIVQPNVVEELVFHSSFDQIVSMVSKYLFGRGKKPRALYICRKYRC